MAWAVFVVRILVGGMFLFGSTDYFFHYSGIQLDKSGWLPKVHGFYDGLTTPRSDGTAKYMDVVKACELIGGLLLLTGRMAPLGLTFLVPVTVNIALWDIFLVELKGPPMGLIFLGLELFLLFAYRRYFADVFTTLAKPG